MSAHDKLVKPGPKKLLALDAGGVRGLISIEVLAEIERQLQRAQGLDDTFVLADYFDYIAGTSVGSITATGLALGLRVDQLRDFYFRCVNTMFVRANLLNRLYYMYDDSNFAQQLKELVGEETKLGSEKLKTLLMIVMRNATNGTSWPINNNPRAKYNDPQRAENNLNLPLWQLIRASNAAPTLFPPEVIEIGRQSYVFVDGSLTMYANPAFHLFLTSTLEPYGVNWSTGVDKMLLVSVGTGTNPGANANLKADEMNLLYNLTSIPSALLASATYEQDMLCRVFGNCLAGEILDFELGDLTNVKGPTEQKLFTYVRYNVELSGAGLSKLGLNSIKPENVQPSDSVEHLDDLQMIGKAAARAQVKEEHFAQFLDVKQAVNVAVQPIPDVKPTPQLSIEQGEEFLGDRTEMSASTGGSGGTGGTITGIDWWRWWVFIKGAPEELDNIEHVTYMLHPTFHNPVRKVTDRSSNFRLENVGWGGFRINAKVTRKDGTVIPLSHELMLHYPDGTETLR
jgi:patatin-like phospholipase/acyl hydrolase